MKIEIKVPVLPESVAEATLVSWHKKPGEAVKRDENLVDIETDNFVDSRSRTSCCSQVNPIWTTAAPAIAATSTHSQLRSPAPRY